MLKNSCTHTRAPAAHLLQRTKPSLLPVSQEPANSLKKAKPSLTSLMVIHNESSRASMPTFVSLRLHAQGLAQAEENIVPTEQEETTDPIEQLLVISRDFQLHDVTSSAISVIQVGSQ